MDKIIHNYVPWSKLKLVGDGEIIQKLEQERRKSDSIMARIDRWDTSKLIGRPLTRKKPATFDEMLPLWVGDAALRPISESRRDEYANFLSQFSDGKLFVPLVQEFATDRGSLLECDLGPVHDYILIKHFYYNNMKNNRNIILEIGGGYGRLAEIFTLQKDLKSTYILCDGVPESIFYSCAYLKSRLPAYNIFPVFNNCEIPPLKNFDIIILPSWRLNELKSDTIDIAINVASIQEMPDHTAKSYFIEVERLLKLHSLFFFENSREFFHRREYIYPNNWKYLFKKRSPRSRTIDYPVDILKITNENQDNENLLIISEYYKNTTNLALDEIKILKQKLADERGQFQERRDRLIDQNAKLREKMGIQDKNKAKSRR